MNPRPSSAPGSVPVEQTVARRPETPIRAAGTNLLDAVIDRIVNGEPVTVTILEPPTTECRYPQYRGVAAYTAGCRCTRCGTNWREYRREWRRGVRRPMGRHYGPISPPG